MTTNSAPHQPDDEVSRWAATAGQHKLRAPRWATRLFCSRRQTINGGSGPDVTTSGVPWSVRQRVLWEYHAGNLAVARRASEEMVCAGFNTGAVPYGYRAQRVRVVPAGRRPRWRARPVIEPVEAEDGLAITAIRQRLVAARYLAPRDPETGQPGVWTRAVVRAILRNRKYTGRQVWGRRHHGRHTPPTPVWAHAPLTIVEEFAAAHRRSWRTETPPGDSEAAAVAAKAGRVINANYYPDGVTVEVITALQQEGDAELRKEGYPVPAMRSARTRRPSSGPSRTTTARSLADVVTGPARRRAGDDGPRRHRRRGTGQKDGTPPAMRHQLRR